VLIADDAVIMRMMLRDILAARNYEIAGEAENGAAAVGLYKRLKPDLVLMDITMPVMDGIDALREIVSSDPGAKIVMVSAMGQQSMVIKSIKSGAVDFIVKPFRTERVLEAVNKALYDNVVS